jgi:hypothetical protein
MTGLHLTPAQLARAAEAAAAGELDETAAGAAAAAGWSDRDGLLAALQVVAAPVLRVTVEGRRDERMELAQVWSDEAITVLAASGDDGLAEVVVGHTSHLPLQLAAMLGLAPRRREHGVDDVLRLPPGVAERLLEGERPALPEDLPTAWRRVLESWGPGVRRLQVTSGFQACGGGEQWRALAVIDDPDRGLFLVQRAPESEDREVLPTDPGTVLRLLTRLLRAPSPERSGAGR